MHKYQSIADRFSGQQCRVYTLDGIKEGTISGRLNNFATVRTLEGASYEFNWPTVERKMESDKLFYVC